MISSEKHNSGDSPSLRSTSHQSISPSGRFCSSPTTITVRRRGGYVSSSPSIQCSINHRHKSPHRTVSSSSNINGSCNRNNSNNNINNNSNVWSYGSKKMCTCSPTTHRGSFRCSLHKHSDTVSYRSNRLYARRSAMSNSVVRIGTVEGDLVKRALAALIRPSSHHRRRRSDFQPRRSRLSVMSNSDY